MKRYVSIAAMAAMLFGAGTGAAFASTQGYYFSGLGGVSLMPSLGLRDNSGHSNSSFDPGYAFGGAFGYDTGNGWRYELTSIYQKSDVDRFNDVPSHGHLWSSGLMANATYDLTRNTQFTPYVGAGVGAQYVGGQINGLSGNRWRPAYQLEGGLRDDLSPQTSIFAEYRFTQSEATKLTNSVDLGNQHFSDHLLLAGVTFHLGE